MFEIINNSTMKIIPETANKHYFDGNTIFDFNTFQT
jgi:hypothetical protein